VHHFLTTVGVQELSSKVEHRNMRDDLKLLAKHALVRSYMLEFYKCDSSECTHCTQHPVQCTGLFKSLAKTGGRLATPEKSPFHQGYYLTMLDFYGHDFSKVSNIDGGQPSLADKSDCKCKRGC